MRAFPIILSFLLPTVAVNGQTTSSRIDIYKLYSQIGEYYLQSIPFDNEEQSIFGKTYVFRTGEDKPLYTVDRYFNYTGYPNKINLSNDGQTIFYINDRYGNDNIDERKSITIYTRGQLTKYYAVSDLNNCDDDNQDCYLLYSNMEVINRDSTTSINHQLSLGFNEGTSLAEQFANNSNIFSYNDTIYLIDQFKQLKTFDLRTGDFLNSSNFDSNYSRLKSIARTNLIEIEVIKSPAAYDLPLLLSGESVSDALASHLNMAILDIYGKDKSKYKQHTVVVDAIIDTDGNLEINELKIHGNLPEQEIRDFLTSQTFDVKMIPKALEKWRFDEYMFFRNRSKATAKKEKKQERKEEREAYLKRLTQDSIDGFYIPRNLGECFVQLDSLLKQKDREKMKSLASPDDMTRYHSVLGMYLRNNWGLWGGSRLQQYFLNRSIYHPDDMSGIILRLYHDWLNDKTETWKEWEEQ